MTKLNEEENAYSKGRDAYDGGESLDSNPYFDIILRRAWIAGFKQADSDSRGYC